MDKLRVFSRKAGAPILAGAGAIGGMIVNAPNPMMASDWTNGGWSNYSSSWINSGWNNYSDGWTNSGWSNYSGGK